MMKPSVEIGVCGGETIVKVIQKAEVRVNIFTLTMNKEAEVIATKHRGKVLQKVVYC